MYIAKIIEYMITAIRGYYESGRVILKETPPVNKRTEVIVTFLTDEGNQTNEHKRVPGALKGKVNIPDDFNEPLEDLNEYQ